VLPRLILFVFLSLPTLASAQTRQVEPYLQLATPTSIDVMWESDAEADALVEYGLTDALGLDVAATTFGSNGDHWHHHAELTGLAPATRYHYRVLNGSAASELRDFVTPAEASAEADLRIVAMSDMQNDWTNPNVFEEVVNEGVIGFTTAEWSDDLAGELSAVVIPGDLVDNGLDYAQWSETFFEPGENLFGRVPVYPVPGNHELDSGYFFDYFALPGNEHWWTHDLGNVRIVGLDSNGAYRTDEQLEFLDAALTDACAEASIDFVFAQLHHPHKSELWLAGETGWTGDVIERLEAFSTSCEKPSLHFFGHTHGYSRGQSRDHRHLMVNVATAGGNIDYWDEYAQADYDEYVVSQDEWGFVMMEVQAGADPSFRLRRVSRGNENLARDNEVRDDLVVRSHNEGPGTPVALGPAEGDTVDGDVVLVASAYGDPDGDLHGGSQWQVADGCDDWAAPVADVWKQHRNEYGGVDLQAGDDLTDHVLGGLAPGRTLCWRVRYRDRGLSWSEWSEGAEFRTAGDPLTDNLLSNPGAEDGLTGWTIVEGTLESVAAGECDSVEPHTGDRFFVVGGVCADEAEIASAVQRVDLTDYAEAIDDGRADARLSGWFRDFSGDDLPEVEGIAVDEGGAEIARTERFGAASATWVELADTLALPVGTRALDFVLHGTRSAGSDNDSYLDDLALRLAIVPLPGDDDDSAGDDDDAVGDDDDSAGEVDGCGCATDAGSGRAGDVAGLAVLLALVRRRRTETV